jgi:hypothetical protein
MKLREIIRPQLNEDLIPARAKTWWSKYGKTIITGLAVINVAMLIKDVGELMSNIRRLPKTMTEEDRMASVLNEVGKLVATYGLPEVMWAVGAVAGGVAGGVATAVTGPGFVAGAGAGAGIGGIVGALAYFPVSFMYGDDINSLVKWLVKKYYLGDTTRPIREPDDAPEEEPTPYKPDPRQQAYRRAQTGMDTPNNPNPRLHPERYPQD